MFLRLCVSNVHNREERKGPHRVGIASFAYLPLSFANPAQAGELVAKVEAGINAESLGSKPQGLIEAHKLQLEALKDDACPDIEITGFPSFFASCTCPPSPSPGGMVR